MNPGGQDQKPEPMTGTALYRRMIAFDYGDEARSALMRKVWDGTPWMVDAYIGAVNDLRERDMIDWCREVLGDETLPLHGRRPGRWYRGCVTIHGWTWFGFTDEADMEVFVARWPAPEGVVHPEQRIAPLPTAAPSP